MSIRVNPEVLSRNVSDDVKEAMLEVSGQVEVMVAGVIAKYKEAADAELKKFEAGKFPEQLQKQIDSIETDYTAKMTAMEKDIEAMTEAFEAVVKLNKDAGAAGLELEQHVAALKEAAEALNSKMKKMRTDVAMVGTKTASAAVTAAYKAFTGGVL